MNRQVVLDTETTGLSPTQGHRVIEIGCIEIVNRRITGRTYHEYIHPERDIDEGAARVHGITLDFLDGKPVFAQIAASFFEFVKDAELVIHNAPFDVGFLDAEFKRLGKRWPHGPLSQFTKITDTLTMARQKHAGQKNNLDALCKRYKVDGSERDLHGALLDSELLAQVYLAMTGGQTTLSFDESPDLNEHSKSRAQSPQSYNLPVIYADAEACAADASYFN